MNSWKKFEKNFKDSVPKEFFCYRLRDSASTYYWWNDSLSFSTSNICDFIVFTWNVLWLLELKTTKGKSLPFGNIKSGQLKWLNDANYHNNVQWALLINYSILNLTYLIKIDDFIKFKDTTDRKSVSIGRCQENWIEVIWILKRVNYKYDLSILNIKPC